MEWYGLIRFYQGIFEDGQKGTLKWQVITGLYGWGMTRTLIKKYILH